MKGEITYKIEITSTKILAWLIFIVGFAIIGIIPESDRARYLGDVFLVIAALYGVKNIQELFRNKSVSVQSHKDYSDEVD